MSFIRDHSRILLVAASCTALGAGASAIASAGAAGSASGAHARTGALRGRELRRFARHAVQGSFVVHTAKRGFVTVSFHRGKVDAVDGQQLTLTEGTKAAAYKTVRLTIPSTAKVRDNRQASTLSALQPGQRVVVLTAPQRTFVIAHTVKTS
jgi:hypothetical protein